MILNEFLVFTVQVGLLAVASADSVSDGGQQTGIFTAYACENAELHITCQTNTSIIVHNANYGRLNTDICNDKSSETLEQSKHWNTSCISTQSLTIVRARCFQANSCIVSATNEIFDDPCVHTRKYLEVEYQCFPGVYHGQTTLMPTVKETTTERELKTSFLEESTSVPYHATTDDGRPRCPAERKRSVMWPATVVSSKAVSPCPNNAQLNKAYRQCGKKRWIGFPDLSQCISQEILDLYNKSKTLNETFSFVLVEDIMDGVEKVSQKSDLYGGDLTMLAKILEETVDVSSNSSNQKSTNFTFNSRINEVVANATSSLLSVELNETWMDLSETEQKQTATRLMSTVESSSVLLANSIVYPYNITRVADNLVVEIKVVSVGREYSSVTFPDISWNQLQSPILEPSMGWIQISESDIRDKATGGLGRLAFTVYANIDRWLKPESNETMEESDVSEVTVNGNSTSAFEPRPESPSNDSTGAIVLNTRIISASLISSGGKMNSLRKPVIYVLAHKTVNISDPKCVFWNFSKSSFDGRWSGDGCRSVSTNTTHTTCECDHLTNFAVLMSVTPYQMSDVHKFTLSLITYFGCMISIICLALAFVTFYWFRNLQCDRNTIHKNLVFCLLVSEVIFLLGIVQYDKPILCAVVAGFLHYFFLASFAWMCLEGVQLYVLLIEVFEAEKSRIKWYYLGAYGLPAVIVGISVAVDHNGYGTPNHCWLKVENGFIWSFVAPVICIIAANSVMLAVAIYTMCRHAATAASWKMKQKSRVHTIASWIKGAAVLVVLLGSTWAFGLLYINQNFLFMAYIFTILNSLQGLFIFVFHCLTSEKVQKEYKRCIQRSTWIPESLRVRYGGASGSGALSSAPNQSTSSGNVPMFFRMLKNRKRNQSLSSSSFQKSQTGLCNSKKGRVRIVISPPADCPSSSHKVKRHVSSGSESARLTDSSGIASHDYDAYFEDNTEDVSGYLDPVLTHVDENEFNIPEFAEVSAMEGSVIYLDYDQHKHPSDVTSLRNGGCPS